MKLFQITRTGLTAIAALVVVLWSCFFLERGYRRESVANEILAARTLRQLRRQRTLTPVSYPAPAAAQAAARTALS